MSTGTICLGGTDEVGYLALQLTAPTSNTVMKATVTTVKDDINHLVVRFFLSIFISLSLNMYTSRLARPLTFFIGKWLNLTGIMGFTFLFPLVYALTSGADSRFILHEQNLYQISSNSFLVYSNSPGGD